MLFCLRRYMSILPEKQITAKNAKKKKRQQLIQNYRYAGRLFDSEKGAMIILGFNLLILLFAIMKVLKLNWNFSVLYFISFGISFFALSYLHKNDFYQTKYIPEQMKQSEEERIIKNVRTFLVFSILPVCWFLWMIL